MNSSQSPEVNAYIARFPKDVAEMLGQLRSAIRAAAPDATEAMAYGIPTFKLRGNLVHFGGFTKHIGFFPGPSGVTAFEDKLGKYSVSKGAIRFPLTEPLPLDLIRKIVEHRVKENLAKQS